MVGKTFWRHLALPSVLHGTNILNLTKDDIRKLRTVENSIYKQLLGAPCYAQICTLRGEMGSSNVKARIIDGKIL